MATVWAFLWSHGPLGIQYKIMHVEKNHIKNDHYFYLFQKLTVMGNIIWHLKGSKIYLIKVLQNKIFQNI